MTPEEHNKTLGILHLVYGAFHALLLLVIFLFVSVGVGFATINDPRDLKVPHSAADDQDPQLACC